MCSKKSKRFLASVTIDARSILDAMHRPAKIAAQVGFRPSRPPTQERMPDQVWQQLQAEFDLPNITADGVDVRAYLEHLRANLRDGLAKERRQRPLLEKYKRLQALLTAEIGDPMPQLCPEVVELLAGMGTLDLRVGSRDTAKYRAVFANIFRQGYITDLIHDWAAWVAMFGAFKRSHNVLRGGKSSFAEVAAISELINFTRDILGLPDSNWVGISTREKRIVGVGRRARVESLDLPIAGWQTRFIRSFLTQAGVLNKSGGHLTLPQARQRIERCRAKMKAGATAGYGPNALWQFLEQRRRASVPMPDE